MIEPTPFVVALKALTVVLGGTVTYFAARAARATGSRALRSLAVGFGIVTAGSLLAGAVDQLLGLGIETGVFVQSLLTAAGFAVLARALYVETESDRPRDDRQDERRRPPDGRQPR